MLLCPRPPPLPASFLLHRSALPSTPHPLLKPPPFMGRCWAYSHTSVIRAPYPCSPPPFLPRQAVMQLAELRARAEAEEGYKADLQARLDAMIDEAQAARDTALNARAAANATSAAALMARVNGDGYGGGDGVDGEDEFATMSIQVGATAGAPQPHFQAPTPGCACSVLTTWVLHSMSRHSQLVLVVVMVCSLCCCCWRCPTSHLQRLRDVLTGAGHEEAVWQLVNRKPAPKKHDWVELARSLMAAA